MDKINHTRQEIDIIDDNIMRLLDERFEKTNLIGLLKKESKTTVLDQNREQTIFTKTTKFSHSPELKVIYSTIMNESKKLQRK
jgi:chorismate mutase